ncbi:hypothetical protein VCR15J5_770052 [Vibrio crassostreae]|nr:hypothetical protein VCR15J5_770052 [Vibrio crassostreae]
MPHIKPIPYKKYTLGTGRYYEALFTVICHAHPFSCQIL